MKFTILALPALFLSAAASPIEARNVCTATFTGSNSEGGGGPGQAPINNNAWGIDIIGGGKKFHTALKQTGKNGVMDKEIDGKEFGSKKNANIHAQWNYGGNSWYRCSVKSDGKEHAGKVEKQHISTGTVSVTTDKCVVTWGC